MSQQKTIIVKIAASTGAGDAASAGAAFEQHAQPVQQQIEALGGRVIGKIWLTSSLKATIDEDKVDAVKAIEGVVSVQP